MIPENVGLHFLHLAFDPLASFLSFRMLGRFCRRACRVIQALSFSKFEPFVSLQITTIKVARCPTPARPAAKTCHGNGASLLRDIKHANQGRCLTSSPSGSSTAQHSTCLAMRSKVLQILWHSKDPVYSLDFHPNGHLATVGQDKEVMVSATL